MRFAILLPLLLAGCAAAGGRANTARVMTYNIHAGKDSQQQLSIDRMAALIDSAAADIVLLQEVDRRTTRSQGADHFQELMRLTGMHGVFGKSLDYQGGEYGIAVLSRWPLDSIQAIPLRVEPPQERSGGVYEPRIALHVVARSPVGTIHVVNTHLDPAGTGTFRKQELIGVMAHMARHVPQDAVLVFGGDLNARPDTDDIQAVAFSLRDSFADCGEGAAETFPSHAPDRRIDYIFLRGARCTTARVLDSQASDHRPLLTILQS